GWPCGFPLYCSTDLLIHCSLRSGVYPPKAGRRRPNEPISASISVNLRLHVYLRNEPISASISVNLRLHVYLRNEAKLLYCSTDLLIHCSLRSGVYPPKAGRRRPNEPIGASYPR
ncbi:MAG: hypothetical protein ACYTF1_09900, partial [Planctomycetota bacterium]